MSPYSHTQTKPHSTTRKFTEKFSSLNFCVVVWCVSLFVFFLLCERQTKKKRKKDGEC